MQSGYSYGISGYDGWGCEISRTLKVQVHQYDCFNLQEPVCRGGTTIFHALDAETDGGEPCLPQRLQQFGVESIETGFAFETQT